MRIFFIALILAFFSPFFAGAQTRSNEVLVTVAEVREGLTQPTMDITGSAYFSLSSAVASESSGKIAKVYINEGDPVEVGEPLAAIDNSLLSFSLESAKAKTQQAFLTYEKTKRDYLRNDSLFKQNAVSQQKYQDSLTDYKTAENAYASAKADENKLKTEIDKMIIRSPLKGVVTAKNVNAGEWVNSGGVVADVAALTFEAKIYLPEKVLPFVNVGDTLPIFTQIKEFKGKILSINSKGDPATRTFLTRVSLGSDPSLKEGVLATARVPSGKDVKALFVPRDSVAERNLEKGVFKAQENSVRFIPVKIVGYSGGDVAVQTDFLKSGDKVILGGVEKVNPGSKIKISDKLG